MHCCFGLFLPFPLSLQITVVNTFDLNNDGAVNSMDISLFFAAWTKAKTGNIDSNVDFNKDGSITSLDYSLLIQQIRK